MPFTSEYQNYINQLNVIEDVASENLVPRSVWLQHVLRASMPMESQTKEIPKDGELGRLVLPENVQYTYGAYSEYIETSVLLNPIKSVVISRITDESEKFGRQNAASKIGREQGKALSVGMEEDIATLAASFTSVLTTASPATQLDLQACALNVQISTNGHAVQDSALVAMLHPKTAFEAGVENVLDPTSGALPVFGNPNSSSVSGLEAQNSERPNGFVVEQYGLAIYRTTIIDDDTTSYLNLIFDPSRALVGVWDDEVRVLEQLEIEYFRNRIASRHYSDFEILWDEAGCRFEAPVL